MHYYQWNIGDYASHTKGLTLMEDLAYRRFLDEYYLSEKPLPLDLDEASRLIGMQEYQKECGYVLKKFFSKTRKGYKQARAEKEISKYTAKSQKARDSAKCRWNAKAMRTHTEGNAEAMLTNNHKPITNNHSKGGFRPPSVEDVKAYCLERGNGVNPDTFVDFYSGKGWMVGKNKMRDWKAAVRTWEQREPKLDQSGGLEL